MSSFSYFHNDLYSQYFHTAPTPAKPGSTSPCVLLHGHLFYHQKPKEHTVICSLWLQKKCNRNDCSFSHDPHNIKPRDVPRDFKTQVCRSALLNTPCNYNFNCNFRHNYELIERVKNLVYVKVFSHHQQQWVISRIGRINN